MSVFYIRNIRKCILSTNSSIAIQYKCLTNAASTEIPVIKVPKYLEKNLSNSRYQEHERTNRVRKRVSEQAKSQSKSDPKHSNKLLISSNGDKSLNHYYGYRYNLNNVPSISKSWIKQSSVGSQMTFHRFDENPSLLQRSDITFENLGLCSPIISSIDSLIGAPNCSPSLIQAGTIPSILANRHIIFSSETGSGKTIAYLAPIIQMIGDRKRSFTSSHNVHRSPLALVLLPSRELTEQVGDIARKLASSLSVGVATILGGIPKGIEHTGMDIVVTTIGMVESHLAKGVYDLARLEHLVLDEADTLLDDTFAFESMDLLDNLNLNNGEATHHSNVTGTRLICSSATMPTTLDSTIGTHLDLEADVDRITTKNLHTLHPNVKHTFHRVHKFDKELKIIEILKQYPIQKKPTIVFGNRANGVNWLWHYLNENGFHSARLTSQMTEEERFHSFNSFQNGEVDLIVCTDLGSRGLDTTRARHVINYDCPHFVSDYIHRAGRTGRLSSDGLGQVTSLVSFKPDTYMLIDLERSLRLGVESLKMNANIRAQLAQKWADKRDKLSRNS